MNIERFYNLIGGDFEEVIETLGLPEEFIETYLTKIYKDTTYESLETAIVTKDYGTIESAAHTLKGNAVNLGLGNFGKSTSALVNCVRGKEYDKVEGLFEKVKKDYQQIRLAYEETQ